MRGTIKKIISLLTVLCVASVTFVSSLAEVITAAPIGGAYYIRNELFLTNELLYEMGNELKARYAKPNVNLALKKSVKASYELTSAGETAAKAVDGITNTLHDKWCTGYGRGQNQWIEVDLGGYYYFDRWKVTHSKWYDKRMYTDDFKLQYKYNDKWFDADVVENNTLGVTDRTMPMQRIARYVRLYVDNGDFDNCVRIHEFELYNSKGYVPMPGDILLTEDSTPDHAGIVYNSTTTVEASSGGVTTYDIGKWYRAYGSFKVMRVKNASFAQASGAANYAFSKVSYPYNYNFADYKNTSSFYCTSLVYRSWRSNGVSAVNLDSDLWVPPLTASDIMDDNDTYTIYDN
jgi:uncharacterized protein YycO